MLYFPAVLHRTDAQGLSGCHVPDFLIVAGGRSDDDALRDALGIMEELMEDMVRDNEPLPDPTPAEEVDLDGGMLVMLAAVPPPSIPNAA